MNLVSIIIPCYNYGWLLSETLESVIEQTYSHWECIVVDDGSIDNTRLVVEQYVQKDQRILYLYQNNQGLSAARNTGLKHAKGVYVQLLDADDLLASRKLHEQVRILDKHSNYDIVYGDVRYFLNGHRNQLSKSFDMLDQDWMPKDSGTGTPIVESLMQRNVMVVCAPLIRKEVFDNVGLFNIALGSLEDWEYWVRCGLAGVYFYYQSGPDTLSYVRVHGASMSQVKTRMLSNELKARQQISLIIKKDNYSTLFKSNYQKIIEIKEYLAGLETKHGNWHTGLTLFLQLACETSCYRFYIRNALYCLRHRIFEPGN